MDSQRINHTAPPQKGGAFWVEAYCFKLNMKTQYEKDIEKLFSKVTFIEFGLRLQNHYKKKTKKRLKYYAGINQHRGRAERQDIRHRG